MAFIELYVSAQYVVELEPYRPEHKERSQVSLTSKAKNWAGVRALGVM